ncbi:MAG: sensor histidine kinase [Candidatus Hodarchaeales archaeon]
MIVQIDKERFNQALDNLIENALKQTDKNTRKIKLFVQSDQNNVRISVQDNGVGIEQNQLSYIFEKYTSIKTDMSAKGTSIGLYIAQQIIEVHGGTLTAESSGKGHGATFHIQLPISLNNTNG